METVANAPNDSPGDGFYVAIETRLMDSNAAQRT